MDEPIHDRPVGQVTRDADGAVEGLTRLLERVRVDVREDEMCAAGSEIVRDLAPDARGGSGHDRDLPGELGRRRRERQLVELERPVLEVVDLGLGEPARSAEAIEGGGDRGMAVRGELEPSADRADVGADGRRAERRDQERARRRLVGADNGVDVVVEPDHARAGPDPEHVIRRAPHRGHPLDVGPPCERLLRQRGTDDLPAFAREPSAKPHEEALHDAAVGLANLGSFARPEVVARQPDQLQRQVVRLVVRLAPGHEPVMREHHRPGPCELGDPPREGETGSQVGDDRDVLAERIPHGHDRIRRVRERADRVGVDVIDVRRRQEGMQQRLDRRPRAVRLDEAAREVGDHLLVAHRCAVAEREQVVEPEPREVAGAGRREIRAAALDPDRPPLTAEMVPLEELRRGVAATVEDKRRIGPDQPRARDQPVELGFAADCAHRAIVVPASAGPQPAHRSRVAVALIDGAHGRPPRTAWGRHIHGLADPAAEQRGTER